MDLDWCTEDKINGFQLFNDNSVIIHKTSEKSSNKCKNSPQNTILHNKQKKELDVSECFNLNLDSMDKLDILEILNYLSFVSNNLRTIIRNKNLISGFDQDNFDNLMKYLTCQKKSSLNNINHFAKQLLKIQLIYLCQLKPYQTQNDLYYLNWIFSDKWINIIVHEDTSYEIKEIHTIENINAEIPNVYFIDKNVIFKCFDVISYVLNKMFEESSTFLNYDIESFQINL